MAEMNDLLSEAPAELLIADGDEGAANSGADDTADDTVVEDEVVEDEAADDTTEEDEPDEGAGEADDTEDEYDIDLEDEPKPEPKPANQPAATDENSYILQNLNKIAVRIVMPGDKEGETVEKTVEVYGYGDLPRDYLGFATPYEAGVFNQAVVAQEGEARRLQTEYRQNKVLQENEDYTRKENRAIAEDLKELRDDGLFPKFKGTPGSKEWNSSDGAKEFDRVVSFMNERNARYADAYNKGQAYRHIGFREAYDMLNGPNQKANEKREQQSRKAAAGRLVSGRGTKSSDKVVSTKPVQKITDLEDEFASFVGGAK